MFPCVAWLIITDKKDKPDLLQLTRSLFKSMGYALSREVNRQGQRNRTIPVSITPCKYTEHQKSCTTYIFAIFSQMQISFEILTLILTYEYKSLYFKMCPSNFSFVVLSLQPKLESPIFLHTCSRNRELKYIFIFLTVRV